ncbi:hypothetical protein ABT112_18060 [Streptomyces sp. NPDC002055]|uniref:hypothetical protein n=1 Tax=Streptomyces sp. NPDC002055 TaxID=3154534 RepID=UPI00332B62A3
MKVGIWVLWFAVLVVVNKFVLDNEWAELVFTGVSAGLCSWASSYVDRRGAAAGETA